MGNIKIGDNVIINKDKPNAIKEAERRGLNGNEVLKVKQLHTDGSYYHLLCFYEEKEAFFCEDELIVVGRTCKNIISGNRIIHG